MKRRELLAALALLAMSARPVTVLSQQRSREAAAKVAILDNAPEATRADLWLRFKRRLAELGHVEGKNLTIRQRFADGDAGRLSVLAAELVAWKPDVLVAVTTPAALAAKKATADVPIVALGPADPVKSGLVASLSRPGGNVTGVSQNQAEIAGKWVQLAREIVPQTKMLAYLTDMANAGEMLVFRLIEEQARSIDVQAVVFDGLAKSRVEQAFATMERDRVDVLVVATTSALLPHREQIIESAARLRIPAIYARHEYPHTGGLLSYGADVGANFRRGAEYAQRILDGAKPSELPFEMASTFEMVLNVQTAKALGLAIPPGVIARADHVIR
jgi:putative ABC transport system substrate-binding protein